MKTRTSKRVVTFGHPFVLDSFDTELPAGDYDVETDEELLEGISFTAYRRILTVIHLPPKPGRPGVMQTLSIDPNELDAALERDRRGAETDIALSETVQRTPQDTKESRLSAVDRQAIERAENEGMVVHPR